MILNTYLYVTVGVCHIDAGLRVAFEDAYSDMFLMYGKAGRLLNP